MVALSMTDRKGNPGCFRESVEMLPRYAHAGRTNSGIAGWSLSPARAGVRVLFDGRTSRLLVCQSVRPRDLYREGRSAEDWSRIKMVETPAG
jgi:hypothetical protein